MLTEQQIRDMEPGRNLNVLVAMRLMGYEPSGDRDGQLLKDGKLSLPKPYSNDISAAWEVVEKMRLDHWYFMLSSENDGWEASFYWDAHRPSEDVLSKSPAEAIAKCALIAILRGGSGE